MYANKHTHSLPIISLTLYECSTLLNIHMVRPAVVYANSELFYWTAVHSVYTGEKVASVMACQGPYMIWS